MPRRALLSLPSRFSVPAGGRTRGTLASALHREGWDVEQFDPEDPWLPSALRDQHLSLVVVHQPLVGDLLAALERDLPALTSTPALLLDAKVLAVGQSPLRSCLPPGSDLDQILARISELVRRRPGPRELSRQQLLRGVLGPGRLEEFLEFLSSTSRTGSVEFGQGTRRGWIWLESGHIRHALFAGFQGVEAVNAALKLDHGEFLFRSGLPPPGQTVEGRTLQHLMDHARRKDEDAVSGGRLG